MADSGESIQDALLFALEDLRGENFKRFKYKLCFLHMEGRETIAQEKLANADRVDTVQLLLKAYGEEGAQEVAVQVLNSINVRNSATRLQNWKYNDWKKKYKRYIQDTFWNIPELGSDPALMVSLHQRYTELLLSRKLCPQERTHELVAVERRHRKEETHPGDCLEVGVENLFDPDAEGKSSRTVVLLGPAGVGKTTAMRKLMLDWASGKFWPAKFEYVFYISCRVVNYSSKPMSVDDLILNCCPPGTPLTEDIFLNQDSVLFLVDGFGELEHGGLPSDVPSSDPHKKQAAASLVMGLLRKNLLARCHLIVATRPLALGPLLQCLRLPQFVEVLGFRPAQRKEYFHHFFEDKEEATQAFELVRSNATVFSMCFLPVVCWVICTIFRQKPQRECLKDIPETATVTEIHMRLLLSFLECHSRWSDLEGLCSLAKDGMLQKTMAFDKEVLKDHGLGCSGLENLSSSKNVLHPDTHITTTYRFIHLSFQEFFAALFYLLDTDTDTERSFKDLAEVLGNKKEYSGTYFMFVHFLFGLSNTKRLSVLQETWGLKLSRTRLCQELLRWVKEEAKCHSFRKGEQLLELCHCLYEMEDPAFAKSVMAHVRNLDLQDQLFTKLDFAALSFCLSSADTLCSLQLSGYELGPTGVTQLFPGLLKSSEIQLNHCGLTAAACKDFAAIVSNQSLTSLDLGENPLEDFGVSLLCAGLIDPRCKLLSLRLHRCNLTAAACEPLSQFLASNQCLTELDLSENPLGDAGARKLCAGLSHPQSRLQRLTLSMKSLNQITRDKLRAATPPLMDLVSYYPPDCAVWPAGLKTTE
ncbi:NACHT, LRR and PYD domains-containing protein 3-like isoform X2 [Elgaria multicarinata webbii]|uniref:NACHT, LRR and PYD domains-containing protein 3-like isoform X2 n=1 Tax=Elgaria multicarinata webbii TaxID=159646 RepID=UPI002FCCFCA2